MRDLLQQFRIDLLELELNTYKKEKDDKSLFSTYAAYHRNPSSVAFDLSLECIGYKFNLNTTLEYIRS